MTLFSSEYNWLNNRAELRMLAFVATSDAHCRLHMYYKIDGDTWHHFYVSSKLW